jgi:demethylmenaquinone methyltransferase / 2-methoxy-6-polyprenyl-1,4-benzoquinol methylase
MATNFSPTDPASIREMFGRVAERYDQANRILSFGVDDQWRRCVGRLVGNWRPERILDLASGSGILAEEIRRQNPEAFLVCADFCAPMLHIAKKRGLDHLIVADGMALPFADRSFDVVTIAFGLRNMESLEDALRGISRILRPAGHVVILDFSLPTGPMRPLYRFYLHFILPWLAGFITGQPAAYRYLGQSIERFPRGKVMLDLLTRAGFQDAKMQNLTSGIVAIYHAVVVRGIHSESRIQSSEAGSKELEATHERGTRDGA